METNNERIVCTCCGEEKPASEFRVGQRKCKTCTAAYYKLWYENRKAKEKIEKENLAAVHIKPFSKPDEVDEILDKFTPKQLFENLAKRGYDIEASYVQKVSVKAFVGIVKK